MLFVDAWVRTYWNLFQVSPSEVLEWFVGPAPVTKLPTNCLREGARVIMLCNSKAIKEVWMFSSVIIWKVQKLKIPPKYPSYPPPPINSPFSLRFSRKVEIFALIDVSFLDLQWGLWGCECCELWTSEDCEAMRVGAVSVVRSGGLFSFVVCEAVN